MAIQLPRQHPILQAVDRAQARAIHLSDLREQGQGRPLWGGGTVVDWSKSSAIVDVGTLTSPNLGNQEDDHPIRSKAARDTDVLDMVTPGDAMYRFGLEEVMTTGQDKKEDAALERNGKEQRDDSEEGTSADMDRIKHDPGDSDDKNRSPNAMQVSSESSRGLKRAPLCSTHWHRQTAKAHNGNGENKHIEAATWAARRRQQPHVLVTLTHSTNTVWDQDDGQLSWSPPSLLSRPRLTVVTRTCPRIKRKPSECIQECHIVSCMISRTKITVTITGRSIFLTPSKYYEGSKWEL